MPHNEAMTELWKCFWLWYPSSFNWADLGDFFFFLVILFLLTSLSAVKPFDSFCVSLYRTVWFWCAHWLQPQTLVVRGEPFSLPSLVSDSITVLNCCHLLFQEDLFSKTRSTLQKYWDTPHFFFNYSLLQRSQPFFYYFKVLLSSSSPGFPKVFQSLIDRKSYTLTNKVIPKEVWVENLVSSLSMVCSVSLKRLRKLEKWKTK